MCTHIRFVTFLFLVLSAMPARNPLQDRPRVRKYKTFLDSTPWIPVFVNGPWISGSNRLWDSGFFKRYSGFQNTGLLISEAKFSRIPDSTDKNFSDFKSESGFPHMERTGAMSRFFVTLIKAQKSTLQSKKTLE